MINKSTINALNLKPVTRNKCCDFYNKINAELNTPEAIRKSFSWWHNNHEKLNELWWVLNYYSESLDPERELRARVEQHLDFLALEKSAAQEPDDPFDTSDALEQS